MAATDSSSSPWKLAALTAGAGAVIGAAAAVAWTKLSGSSSTPSSHGEPDRAVTIHGMGDTSQPPAPTDRLHVVLVRHCQSTNNVLADQVQDLFGVSPYAPNTEAHTDYVTNRQADPLLSAKGAQQQLVLTNHPHLQRLHADALADAGRLRLFCSPLVRAGLTVQPLAEAYNLCPHVSPWVFERDGFFHCEADATATDGFKFVIGSGPSAAELKDMFPSYDMSEINETGWWVRPDGAVSGDVANPGEDFRVEPSEEYLARLERVKEWLFTEARAHRERHDNGEAAQDHLLIVSHAEFLNGLMAVLLDLKMSPEEMIFYHENTGITHFELIAPSPAEGDNGEEAPVAVRLRCHNAFPADLA